MNNPEILLSVKNLNKDFPGVKALDNVNLEIYKGEVHALLGENGAGKSTLIKIVAGVYNLDSGEVNLNNKPCSFHSPMDAFKKGLSIIHQETSLIPELTAIQNVFLGIEETGFFNSLNSKKMKTRYKQICDKIGLHINPDVQVKDLSVAEKKIIEIIKALERNASLIIMDEPTDSLTITEIERLFAIIRDLKKNNVTIIYITHYMDEVFEITDRATIMKDGRVIFTDFTKSLTAEMIISAMVGRDLHQNFSPELSSKRGGPALEVKKLCRDKHFYDVSLTSYYGEILGITGVIGSGKTELARAIFGADFCDAGSITVNGKKITHSHPKHALKNGIGMLPEDRKTEGLILNESVIKNLTLSHLEKVKDSFLINNRREKELSHKMVQKLNIKISGLDNKTIFLSGGNQQKVVIAKWLMADPDIIIMDEPTRGIDVGAKSEIYKIMKKLSREGKSIIFISSEVPEIIDVSDRIILMRNGKTVNEYNRGITQKELMHAMLEVNNI